MDLSKLSDADLDALEKQDLSKMSDEGLAYLESQTQAQPMRQPTTGEMLKYWLSPGSPEIVNAMKNDIMAGGAGLATLAAHPNAAGLQQAATEVGHVENEEPTETTAGKVGKVAGSFFTPEQIALQAGIGPLMEAVGLGPWVANVLKSWGEKAAVNAVGAIKNLAKALGIENLDALGQFLLKPITIGGKTFDPIVTATSDTKDMLAAANAIKNAAGQQLGKVAGAADEVIGKDTAAMDWAGLQSKLEALKEAAVGDIPALGKKVAAQFDAAISDLNDFIGNQLKGATDTAFSDLSAIKTKIGNLVYKHGSPLESKAALEDVYHAVNSVLEDAAKNTGEQTGAAYLEMNQIYHKAISIVEGLEGKMVSGAGKSFFSDVPSMVAGGLAGIMNPIAAIPTAVGIHVAKNYGPQAIAAGLNAAAPKVAPLIGMAARSVPVLGNAVSQALGQ